MSKEAAYITGSCVIRRRQVYGNGALLWEDASAETPALPEFLRSAYDRFSGSYPKFHKMDNLSKLGWLAAEILLQQSPLNGYPPEQVALVLSNRSASLDTDLRYYDTVKDIASPALFVYTLPNIVMGEICIRHGFKGEQAFFTSGRFAPEQLAPYVQLLLQTGAAGACLCGWVEVMGTDYEALLCLVEPRESTYALPFTAQQLQKIYDGQ